MTTDLGVITITWQTGEPANSIIRYGTNNLNLNLAATNSALVTFHSMKIGGLIPGRTYYFYVSSADPADNTVIGNNSGSFYSFVAIATPTVLLVDDYDTEREEAAGSTVISDGVLYQRDHSGGFQLQFLESDRTWFANAGGFTTIQNRHLADDG